MAKTKDGRKKVYVREHQRGNTSVRKHYRSTPNPSTPTSTESGGIWSVIKRFFNQK